MTKEEQRKVIFEKTRAAYEKQNSVFNVVVSAANEIAWLALDEALSQLKPSKYYRHEVKRWAKTALKRYQEYEEMHHRNFDERYQIFIDYLDSIDDLFKKDIFLLTMSIKQHLDKFGEKDTKIKAIVETADILLENACLSFDWLFDDLAKESGYNFRRFFLKGRLTGVYSAWQNVVKSICKVESKHINLDKDKNTSLAFEVIRKKLHPNYLNKAGKQAIDLNMDVAMKYITEEELNEMEEQ